HRLGYAHVLVIAVDVWGETCPIIPLIRLHATVPGCVGCAHSPGHTRFSFHTHVVARICLSLALIAHFAAWM
ncbi:MAG: hypothetical protein AAGJ35_15290, partial [Myxococcota bacterium]